MKTYINKAFFTIIALVFVTSFVASPVFAQQSALNASFWSNTQEKIIPNCVLKDEYNPYTNQVTRNEVCSPKVVSYRAGDAYNYNPYVNNSYSNSYNYNYSYPKVGGVPGAVMNFLGLSYPIHNYSYLYPEYYSYRYLDDSMFNTYYRGGYSDYTGYYQPYPYYSTDYYNSPYSDSDFLNSKIANYGFGDFTNADTGDTWISVGYGDIWGSESDGPITGTGFWEGDY